MGWYLVRAMSKGVSEEVTVELRSEGGIGLTSEEGPEEHSWWEELHVYRSNGWKQHSKHRGLKTRPIWL